MKNALWSKFGWTHYHHSFTEKLYFVSIPLLCVGMLLIMLWSGMGQPLSSGLGIAWCLSLFFGIIGLGIAVIDNFILLPRRDRRRKAKLGNH